MNLFIFIITSLIGVSFIGYKKMLESKHHKIISEKYWYPHLVNLSVIYNIPLQILESQIWIESNAKEDVQSSASAKGLMQIKDIVKDEYNKETNSNIQDLFDPINNLTIGVWYLNRLKTHYNFYTIKQALNAYANGIGNVKRGNLPHPDYADKILDKAGIV